MTKQQDELQRAAQEFLAVINTVVPDTTVHWMVEEARTAARRISRHSVTVQTFDHKGGTS